MANFRIVETYLPGTAKGCCYLCSTSPRTVRSGHSTRPEHVIDTGVEISFEGTLALCESCLVEAAGLLGLVTADQITRLEAVAAEAVSLAEGLAFERDEAAALVDKVLAYRASHPDPAPKIDQPAAVPPPAPAGRPATKGPKPS